MGKILFWVIVIIVGLLIARMIARHNENSRIAEQGNGPKKMKRPDRNSPQMPESMVRCEHCGIHLPRSEALLAGGRTWCSQDHFKLGTRQ